MIAVLLLIFAAGLALPAQPARIGMQRGFANQLALELCGVTGTTNVIQWSASCGTNATWVLWTNVTLPSVEPLTLACVPASNAACRFYRVLSTGLPVTNPCPDKLAWVPPGTFMMGSPATDPDRSANEGPLTTVRITKGFFVGIHEVTQEEFGQVAGTNPSLHKENPYAPVDSVTWAQATNFCHLLTQRESTAGRLPAGYVYRLPTEAEWEYAARAGTTNRFSHGDDWDFTALPEFGWFGETFGLPSHAVMTKGGNRWGLHDVAGNVFEWCLDWLGTYSGGSTNDPRGTATTRPGLRGGSSWSIPRECRHSARLRAYAAGEGYANAGLRVVLARPLP